MSPRGSRERDEGARGLARRILRSLLTATAAAAILCAAAAAPAPASAAAAADGYEPDGSALLAQPITVGGTPQQHALFPEDDEDWVAITVQAGLSYAIATGPGSVPDDPSTQLALYDSDGTTLIDVNWDHYSRLEFTAEADGILYAKVDGWYTGTYALWVERMGDSYEPDGSAALATPLVVGAASQQRSISPYLDEDWASLEVEAGWKYVVETSPGATSEDPDTSLELYASNGTTFVTSDDDGGDGDFSRIEYEAEATGRMYVLVAAGGTGTYALRASRTAVVNIGVAPASIDFGEVAVGDSLVRTVVVENRGTAPLAVGGVELSGAGFAITRDQAGGVTIPVGGSREVDIVYEPTVGYTGLPAAVPYEWTNLVYDYVYSGGILVGYRTYTGFRNEGGAGELGWRVAVGAQQTTGSAAVVAGGRYNVRVSVSKGTGTALVELQTPVPDTWNFQGTYGGLSGVTYSRVPDGYLTIASNDEDDPFIDVRLFGSAVTGAATNTTFTVTSSSVTLARYGAVYRFTGRLASEGTPLEGQTVTLQTAAQSGGPWSSTAVVATTAADGSFTLEHTPRSKTFYRARFAGEGDYGATVSDSRAVVPRAAVGNPAAPSAMYKGKAATVKGTLTPRHTAGTFPVRIYKYRYVAGKWKSYGYSKAKASDYGSVTRYSAAVKLPYKGKWRLRAQHPADAGHAMSWSAKYDSVTVR